MQLRVKSLSLVSVVLEFKLIAHDWPGCLVSLLTFGFKMCLVRSGHERTAETRHVTACLTFSRRSKVNTHAYVPATYLHYVFLAL